MNDKKPKEPKPRENIPENPNDDWEDRFSNGPQIEMFIDSCPASAFDYEKWKREVIENMCFGQEERFDDYIASQTSQTTLLYDPLAQIEEAKNREGPTLIFFMRYKVTGGTLEELRNPRPDPVAFGGAVLEVATPTEEEINDVVNDTITRAKEAVHQDPNLAGLLNDLIGGLEENNDAE